MSDILAYFDSVLIGKRLKYTGNNCALSSTVLISFESFEVSYIIFNNINFLLFRFVFNSGTWQFKMIHFLSFSGSTHVFLSQTCFEIKM